MELLAVEAYFSGTVTSWAEGEGGKGSGVVSENGRDVGGLNNKKPGMETARARGAAWDAHLRVVRLWQQQCGNLFIRTLHIPALGERNLSAYRRRRGARWV